MCSPRKQISKEKGDAMAKDEKRRSFLTMIFRFSDRLDILLMLLGTFGAIGDGMSTNCLLVFVSRLFNSMGYGKSTGDQNDGNHFMKEIENCSLYFVYLGLVVMAVAFMEGYCWSKTSERQVLKIRYMYLKAVLRQEVGFFDSQEATTSEIVNSISKDTSLIQEVLSEKVPIFLMNMSVFISGLVFSAYFSWRLFLVAFPTIFLLIIPGVLYGKYLLHLSNKSFQEYSKANGIVGQALSSIKTVYSFTAERSIIQKYSSTLDRTKKLGIKQGIAKGLAIGSTGLSFAIWALLAWYGSRLVMHKGESGGRIYAAGVSFVLGGLMSLHAGPVDTTVLYQQETHVSNFITPTSLDNTLRVRRSDNLIWELWKSGTLHFRVCSCLHEMGFYGILRCGDLVYDNHLITALVERWRRETHTFHLRVGEATITLQDVALIWGLTVDGDPIIGIDVSYKFSVWQRYCYDWLGFVPVQTDFRANSLKMSALHLHCTEVIIDNNSTDVEVTQYARCVALMIIGGCMLPDSEGCAVKLMYLYFLQDIQRVRQYSWASAVLAFLYHELCAASVYGKQEIAGPLYILQIWAWSRMTPLCPDRLGYNLIAPSGNENNGDIILPIPPYGARWQHVFCWTHTPTHSVRIIRDVLDRMGADQFKWNIYDLDATDVLSLPLDCRHPTLWRSVCPLICFHIVEMHRPNRVLRQFGMSQNIPIPALDGDDLHECSRRGRKNYDWGKHHGLMVDAWENRRNLIVESELVAEFSMRYDYDRWYDLITRRFISPIEPQQMNYGYQPGDAYFRRVVRDETSNIRNMFGGLSVDDQPREVLAEALKNTLKTADLLYEMSLRTPEQHHHARSSNRRRRQRVDDVHDSPSFSTPEWGQSTTAQSSQTSAWPHTSHGEGHSHSTTTKSPMTLTWPSTSHGDGPSYSMTTQQPMTLAWPSTTQGHFSVPSSYTQWPHNTGFNVSHGLGTSHTSHDFQTPQQTYAPLFTQLLHDEHRHHDDESRPNQVISPISYMGYSFPQSSSYVPPNVGFNVGENDNEGQEEEEVEAQPMVRKSKRVTKAPDCGTGHRLRRK